MEVNKQLSLFFETIEDDSRIGFAHITLYLSLCIQSDLEGGRNPVIVKRKITMKRAKIASPQTYFRCLKELSDFGYIKYTPSFHPGTGSTIYFNRL